MTDDVSMVYDIKFLTVERIGVQRRLFTRYTQLIFYEIGLDGIQFDSTYFKPFFFRLI